MSDDFDLAAINDRGVYALCTDDGSRDAESFRQTAISRGHRVERLPLREACDRHLAYLATLDRFKGVVPALPQPTQP